AWLLVNTFLNVVGAGGIAGATKSLFGGGTSGNCIVAKQQKGIDGGAAGGGGQLTGGQPNGCANGQTCQSNGKCGPAQAKCGDATCTTGQVCSTDGKSCVDPQSCTYGGGSGGNEDAVRQQLAAAGVSINKGVCSPPDDHSCGGTPPSCTDVGGMQSATISQIINIANACPGCGVQVTGGTEPGHACGTYSHGNGYKVDLHPTSGLDALLKSLTYQGTRNGDGPGPSYGDSCGNQYVRESDHWDATIKATCSLGH
ncbi:MAG TPA: hypothetical protein VHC20_03130, partial [Candidatus Paceibacterota bacterium]|nr:hypothetical protein [Candidatus Paceibacterota bacterium]